MAWAQDALSNGRYYTHDPHFEKRTRERQLSLQDVKFAVRRATHCEPYPDGNPLYGGTCWRLYGPCPDEDDPDPIRVGFEAYFDTHRGKLALLITLF
ncbi:MAG TPA: hypothetical protein VFS00_24320 [Polyangiaceae bacterium]|nr:hypothetical protein [Polyangiaceae bacterium]